MTLPVHSFSIYDMIKRNACLFPTSAAIVTGEETVTFQDYFFEVNALAAALASQGVQPGHRLAVLAMNCREYMVLYGAAAALSAVLVPLNWRLSQEELLYILSDSGSTLLFFDKTRKDQVKGLINPPDKHAAAFRGKLIAMYDTAAEEDPFLKESDKACELIAYGQLLTHGEESSMDDLRAVENRTEGCCPNKSKLLLDQGNDPLFCLIYTAAVEGKPRGAALSHGNIITANIQTSLTMHLDRQDTYLNMLPLFHITGMNLSLAVMHMGGRNVIMEKFDAPRALDLVERCDVTLMASFPPILSTLMDNMDHKKHQLKSLKHVVGIDSPDNIQKFTKITPSRFWVLYGQSETTGFVTLSDSAEAPNSAGRPCCVSRVAILDENDRELPLGESGEIAVRGGTVFQGFWKGGGAVDGEKSFPESCGVDGEKSFPEPCEGPEKLKKISFDTSTIRNNWHHTGDVGRMDQEGYLWFEGRKPEKELIKPGGENVYPAEVESVVLAHPDIEETCVIGVPDPKFGEGVKAVCVRKKGSDLTEKALIGFVGERIARYKKPGYVEFTDSLPKNGDAVDRIEVKRLYESTD